MKRWIPILVIGSGLVLFWASRTAAQDDTKAARRGAALYAEYCQACHGPQGEAIGEGLAFAAIAYDPAAARTVITAGLDSDPGDGAAMPPYLRGEGGPLSPDQINDVIAYLDTWGTGETPALPQPNITASVTHVPDYFGDPGAGAVVYARFCYGCHGAEGQGRRERHFPAIEDAKDPIRVVYTGTDNPYMPAFAAGAGGPLTEAQIKDLDAYLASWRIKEPERGPSARGIDTLLVIMGVLAVGAVGWFYTARRPKE